MKALHGRFPTSNTTDDEIPRFTPKLNAWRRLLFEAGVLRDRRNGSHYDPDTMVFPGAREDLFRTALYLLVAGGRPLGGFVGLGLPTLPDSARRPFYTLLGHVPED